MNSTQAFSLICRRFVWLALIVAIVSFAVSQGARAQSGQTFYYWVAPGIDIATIPEQSFVIAVDAATSAQIEAIFTKGGRPGFYGNVAVGGTDYNKDYFAPNHPAWNWHIMSVDNIFDFNVTGFVLCQCPVLVANPSDIAINPAEWIKQNGDAYEPIHYQIRHQIDPSTRDSMANVSNRGLSGAGEKTLIAGFIITGGEPRNVVVRALGPSLSASGIQQVAANPAIGVHQGSQGVAGNKDWKKDVRAEELSQKYPSLVPSNDKEAAMLLTLLPGAYTLHGINEDGAEGIMLLEVYDVDNAIP